MPRRYFNWKLAIVLLISCVVIGITAFGLREWRKSNSAEESLILGNKAYNEQNWEQAAKELGRYISVNQNDVPVLSKYAESLLKIKPTNNNNVQYAAQIYRAILRIDKNNMEAANKLTELYILMGRFGDAELIASRHTEENSDPMLRRLYAVALVQQKKYDEAAEELIKLCNENKDQVLIYETTGQFAEQQPEKFSEPAIYWFDEVVKNNPSSALAYIVRAGYYRRNKDTEKALADLEKAGSEDLSDSAVCLRLAREYIELNMLDKAEQILGKVSEESPEDQALWQMKAQMALISQSSEQMLEVAETGLEVLASQPWDFMTYAAEMFIRSGAFDKADDCIVKLKEKDFNPGIISYLEGLESYEKRDLSEAIKQWKYSIDSGNNTARLRIELSSAYDDLGDLQSAIMQLRTLVSERSESFEGHLALAKLLASTGNWAEVLENTSKAIQLDPKNHEAGLLHMQAQMQLANSLSYEQNAAILKNVETFLSGLDTQKSRSLDIELLKIQLEMRKGDFTNVNELIEKLILENPTEEKLILAKAEIFAVQDKTEEAINILNQATDKFPQSAEVVKYLAVLLNREDNRDDSENVIKQALERIDSLFAQRDLYLLLTELYTNWGQEDKAYSILVEFAKKMPDDIPIKRRLLTFQTLLQNSEKAQQLVDEIKSLEGDNGWQWRYEQAKIWYIADDFNENYPNIVSLIQENLLNNPDDLASQALLAKVYEKEGEYRLAIATYHEALNISPENIQIITALVSLLYNVKEYDQADELLSRIPQESQNNPLVQRLQFQNLLRQGQLQSATDILQELVTEDPNNHNNRLTLALLEMQRGEYDESERVLNKLKTENPESLSINAALIQLNLIREKPQEAMEICNEYVNKYQNVSAFILRARTYSSINQPEKALDDINRAIEIDPDNIDVWIARSDYYRSIGSIDKALDDIQKALSLNSDDIQIQKRAITLLLNSNSSELINEGIALVDKALLTNSDDIDFRLFKANLLITKGDTASIESAQDILENLTDENPEASKAWLLLGELMLSKNQLGAAMDMASKGLVYAPNDENLLFIKARAEAARSPILAVPTLKVLCELNPNNIDAVTLLANIYVSTGQPEKAIDFLEQIIIYCDPSVSKAYEISLTAASYKAGHKNQALAKLDTLLEENPTDPAPLLAMVYLLKDDNNWTELKDKALQWYAKQSDNSNVPVVIAKNLISVNNPEAQQAAKDILETVLSNDPDNTNAMSSLAILSDIAGHTQEAVNMYRKLIKIEPQNVVAINNLAWILCENYGQQEDVLKEALELANKGLELAPNYIDLIDTRGMIYFRLNQFNDAVKDFAHCVELYDNSTVQAKLARLHLAKAYVNINQQLQAIKYLKEILDDRNQAKLLSPTDLKEAENLLKELQENN